MAGYQNIAVAGATGNLGPSIVKALAEANLNVTVLSKSGKSNGLPSSVKIVKVDYDSHDSIVNALKGNEAFVSLVPDFDLQPKLIDAAIAAGVQRFIPSEFGSDTQNQNVRSLPVFKGKLDTQEYLKSKEEQISWTSIVNGIFLDWGLQVGFWLNLKQGPTSIYDNGDAKRSTSLLSDIGKSVVAALSKPEETKNRVLYIQSATLSQNQVLAIAQKKNPDLKPEIKKVNTEDLVKDSVAKFLKGPGPEFQDACVSLITVSVFNEKYGSNWSDRHNNDLLGIKELSEKEIEETVAKYV